MIVRGPVSSWAKAAGKNRTSDAKAEEMKRIMGLV
jgi:hypothetical protein